MLSSWEVIKNDGRSRNSQDQVKHPLQLFRFNISWMMVTYAHPTHIRHGVCYAAVICLMRRLLPVFYGANQEEQMHLRVSACLAQINSCYGMQLEYKVLCCRAGSNPSILIKLF